ncbi:Zn(II)2Cys6 transcription factor domain-containing protein [Aspergillus mulundensis]|uniref:Putative Zn(II)2Cys6 transcription factor n=1 Tax=Aspergillus mulundensis TaxID=1810919 RepID=A0A3D8SU80_9EURO|nr:putative Zn(II)2Cys6 transcription factor [Aspergillus mulundensis]RDW89880.1 putative Zn(II)2Cys6 transcription factor [Aspergillus mulundensis]
MSSQDSFQSGSTQRVGKRRAAPYGQACLHCFKTKSKCVRQGNSESCERCIRLKKECSSADSLRKRAAQKPPDAGSAAIIANLQAQNNDLNALLRKVVENSGSPVALREFIEAQQRAGEENQKAHEEREPAPSDHASTTSSDWRLFPEQEETRLAIFRNRMLPFLAFAYLPPDLTAQKLFAVKPLFFQAIMAVTSPSIQERRVRGSELKRLMTQKTWQSIDSSLDLLLCILTYLGWGYDTFVNKASTSSPSRLTQTAMAVAHDLRADTSGIKRLDLLPNEVLDPDQHRHDTGLPDDSVQQILENERAILGCFFLSSMTASHYKRMEPMRWTPQLEEYLDTISRTKGCPTDEGFSFQVRLQVLAQQVCEQREQRELDRYQAAVHSASSGPTEPLLNRWYLEALQKKLHGITDSIPPYLKDNETLLSQLHYTSLSIYETIHPVNSDAEHSSPSLSVSSALDERDCHYHTLQAIRAFFDIFLRFTPLNWAGFPFHLWAQEIRCTSVLIRLSLSPAYRDEVRNTVDVLNVVDVVSDRLKGAATEMGETSPEDLFGTLYRVARMLRAFIGPKLEPAPVPEEQHGALPYVETPLWNEPEMVAPSQLELMQMLGFNNMMATSSAMPYNPSIYYYTYN